MQCIQHRLPSLFHDHLFNDLLKELLDLFFRQKDDLCITRKLKQTLQVPTDLLLNAIGLQRHGVGEPPHREVACIMLLPTAKTEKGKDE